MRRPPISAAATATEAPPWFTYHDPTYGFTIDVPTTLSISGGQPPSDPNQPYQLAFGLNPSRAPSVPADQQTLSQLGLIIQASRKALGACGVGTPVTIGGGVTAYETNNFADVYTEVPGEPPPPNPILTVQFVANGLYYRIDIGGLLPMPTFTQRYGDAVSHILASFRPGPQQAAGSPCA